MQIVLVLITPADMPLFLCVSLSGTGTIAVNTVGGRLPEALKYAYPVEDKGYKLILTTIKRPAYI